MLKFAIISVLIISAVAAPDGLVVPAPSIIATAPAVAVHSIPVGTSYSNTYRAPVLKAAPVYVKPAVLTSAPLVHAAPVTHIKGVPLIATAPVVHPTVLKSTPILAPASPIASVIHPVAVAPVITNHAAIYKSPLIKTHVVAAPVAIVH